jgi:hypothetical protein
MQLARSHRPVFYFLAVCAALVTVLAGTLSVVARSGAATPSQLDLQVLLIGTGSSDPTTAAWQAALTSEGVSFTSVTASGAYGAETVTLPALTTGSTGNFNGVVVADSPAAFAAGQLTALDAYESTYAVRQIDGYSYPTPSLGQVDATSGALDGTTATLTPAGLAGLPALKGPLPFDTGTYGYGATVVAGTPFTPWIENAAGQSLGGVYQHPSTDPQAGVSELSLNFDYNATQLQWLLLAPGLIDWVTQGTHLGLYRNYFGQDVDDNFIADNEWSSQYQCTPGATEPPDYTCPAGVANNPADTPPDVQMSAADVAYVVAWEKQTGITLNLAFNGIGACTAPSAAAESSANCTGSVKDAGGTFTDPGQVVDASYPNDQALINALLADKADFNWIIHTWSHEFLGCIVWQPQALTSVTANATGGSFTAGSYSYEITAATAYGESEPSLPKSATVAANGSVTVTWPDATNGVGTDGTKGPTLAQEEANHTGGTAFWGYNVYRENPGSTTYGLVGQVAENPAGTTATYSFSDTGASVPGATPGSSDTFPTATNPGIDCSSAAGSWDPATSTAADSSIEQEIGLDQAWATANGLPNYTSSAVVTGEHSGIENPNMPAALAGTGVTTFAADASRQPTQYSLASGTNTAISAPRYPSNIYYNASNWPDELNEYNTLYAAPGVNLGNSTYPTETGHCDDTSSTTCLSTPATEATLLTSESRIMLSHVLANNPRVGYAHQTDLIGPATSNGADYGYTILTLINNMLSQYQSWTTTPLVQVTDVSEAQTLGLQSAWTKAQSAGTVTASVQNGTLQVTNKGTTAIAVPVTAPTGTTEAGAAFAAPYGGTLSGWETLGAGASLTLAESVPPTITSANAATSTVGAAFTTTVTTTGSPVPALTESGALPTGIKLTDNGDGSATISGTAAAGTGGLYPITITATNAAGSVVQAFTLTNDGAPTITSPATATFATGVSSTYTVTTTGYPAATITESGTLPSGMTFTAATNGTATISGPPGAAGTFPVTLSATNASGSTATLALTITVNTAAAPAVTSGATTYFTAGSAGAFAVTATGAPTPAITESGALDGLTFTDQGTGTALLSGTPTASGTYPITVTATNGIGTAATQALSIIVGQKPAFTSAASAAFGLGVASSFTVTTSGYPPPSLGETGTLPPGVTFTDNLNGTATIAGTPTGATQSYPVTLAAANGTGTASQSFTLSVAPGGSLPAGGTLGVGQSLTDPSGQFRLTMQGDGNLVEYNSSNQPIWASNTSGNPGATAVMQSGGDLVVTSTASASLWASNTGGNAGAYAIVRSDGNVVVESAAGVPLWGAPSILVSGAVLKSGQSISDPTGQYRLTMQSDGNLVAYNGSNQATWASNTSGNAGATAVMQGDGNLVVYSAANAPLWASNTSGNVGAALLVESSGNVAVQSANGSTLWEVPGVLLPGSTLGSGQSLRDPSGQFRLTMQPDGNLVEYSATNQALWASNTSGNAGATAIMQGDGNFVVDSTANAPLWASKTSGNAGAAVRVRSDGNVVVDSSSGAPLWGTPSILVQGSELTSGQSLSDPTNQYRLTMQGDGNLVEYSATNQVLWASNTSGNAGAVAIMQSDGNFVVYSAANSPLWASNTGGTLGASLVVAANGSVTVESDSGSPLWTA